MGREKRLFSRRSFRPKFQIIKALNAQNKTFKSFKQLYRVLKKKRGKKFQTKFSNIFPLNGGHFPLNGVHQDWPLNPENFLPPMELKIYQLIAPIRTFIW